MKIGIITFHAAHNFGSMLQAYALQTFLSSKGHEVEIINYRSSQQKDLYFKPIFSKCAFRHPKFFLQCLVHPSHTMAMIEKWNNFESFLCNHLKLTKEYCSLRQLKEEKFSYDVVVSGSDQIWNNNPVDFSVAYMIPFADSCTKIAYAPSLGPAPQTTNLKPYTEYLQKFNRISVRESISIPYVQKYTTNKVCNCLDPSLLVDMEAYMPLISKQPIKDGAYIFYYAPAKPHGSNETFELAVKLSKMTGLPLVTAKDEEDKDKNAIKYISSGPCEFLNLIKNATFVCGHSFHMVAFSLIFHKEFYTINAANDSRTKDLLEKLGVKNRDIDTSNIQSFKRSELDYSTISQNLESVRKSSIEFLELEKL